MANKARGLVDFKLGGETFQIGFGLGALAQIEDAFGVESFEDALDFGDKISAAKIRKLVLALLEGNDVEMTPQRRKEVNRLTPAAFMEVLGELFSASGLTKVEASGEEGGAPFADANAGEPG